jgi:hypothetical protein
LPVLASEHKYPDNGKFTYPITIMSKPNRKPASASTNLIGEFTLESAVLPEQLNPEARDWEDGQQHEMRK